GLHEQYRVPDLPYFFDMSRRTQDRATVAPGGYGRGTTTLAVRTPRNVAGLAPRRLNRARTCERHDSCPSSAWARAGRSSASRQFEFITWRMIGAWGPARQAGPISVGGDLDSRVRLWFGGAGDQGRVVGGGEDARVEVLDFPIGSDQHIAGEAF